MTARHPSENAIRRIRTTVKRVEAMPVDTTHTRRALARRDPEVFPAEITGDEADATSGPTGLSWKRMASDGAGGLQDDASALAGAGTAFGINGERPAIGTRVWLRVAGMIDDGSGGQVPIYFTDSIPLGVTFLIKLTQTGGSAGDESTQCSFTYTVLTYDDVELATGVDPTADPHQPTRDAVGSYVAATRGTAAYIPGESEGDPPQLVIATINEQGDYKECGA